MKPRQVISEVIEKEMLTILEKMALQALIKGLYAEPGFSDVGAADIASAMYTTTKRVRGVLSSLVKKGYIQLDDSCSNGEFQIIYLNESKYYLHPEWSRMV